MKTTILSLLCLAVSTAMALPSVFERWTCPTCVASPNNCDITAPCALFVDTLYCACRAGYKAGAYADTDTAHQWRIDTIPGQAYRVWVAPGVVCDTLCDDPWDGNPCSEVSVDDSCPT